MRKKNTPLPAGLASGDSLVPPSVRDAEGGLIQDAHASPLRCNECRGLVEKRTAGAYSPRPPLKRYPALRATRSLE